LRFLEDEHCGFINYTDCIGTFDSKTFKIGEVKVQIMIRDCLYKQNIIKFLINY